MFLRFLFWYLSLRILNSFHFFGNKIEQHFNSWIQDSRNIGPFFQVWATINSIIVFSSFCHSQLRGKSACNLLTCLSAKMLNMGGYFCFVRLLIFSYEFIFHWGTLAAGSIRDKAHSAFLILPSQREQHHSRQRWFEMACESGEGGRGIKWEGVKILNNILL